MGRCQSHPPTSRVYNVAGTLIFLPTHLRVLIFSTKSHISLTRKCLDIAKIEIYIAFLGFYETMDGKYVHFLKILNIIPFTLPRICLLVKKCRRRIQKLSVRAWFFKNFLTTRLPSCHCFSILKGTVLYLNSLKMDIG